MRILVAVAHYFGPKVEAGAAGVGISPRFWHGSTGSNPVPRVEALAACLSALHQLFGSHQYIINQETLVAQPANRLVAGSVDVVVCTTSGCHVLDRLPVPRDAYRRHETWAFPPLLGYECHDVLRQGLAAEYDYFCYMEDDLVLSDPWFFHKLRWLSREVGDEILIQPNRYEVGPLGLVHKAYIDGELPRRVTEAWQNVDDLPQMTGLLMGTSVVFRRTNNPHAGCFFLNRAQMEEWAKRSYFLDRASAFVGPLESAATLGVMRTFRIYKPGPENASFFEIAHHGTAFLSQLRRRGT